MTTIKNRGEITLTLPAATDLLTKHKFLENLISTTIHDLILGNTFPFDVEHIRIIADPMIMCALEVSPNFQIDKNTDWSIHNDIKLEDGKMFVGFFNGIKIHREMYACTNYIEIQHSFGEYIGTFRINIVILPAKPIVSIHE